MESGEVELVGGPLDGRTYMHPASPDNTIRIAMPNVPAGAVFDALVADAVSRLPLAVYVYRRDRALTWRFVYSHMETM